MKKLLLLALLLLVIAPATALASTPVLGQIVTYKYDGNHSYPAIVTSTDLGDGSQALLVLDIDGNSTEWPFGPGSQGAFATIQVLGVIEGTGDNRWSVNTSLGKVTATATPAFSLNGSAIQSDTTRDVELIFTVKISALQNNDGGQAGHIDLKCDSSATPTTIVETAQLANTGSVAVALTISNTFVLRYRVPAGHYCKLVTGDDTGTPTYTLVRQVKQTLG